MQARRGRGVSAAGRSIICSRGGEGEHKAAECARRRTTGRKLQATAAGCCCATENAAGDDET